MEPVDRSPQRVATRRPRTRKTPRTDERPGARPGNPGAHGPFASPGVHQGWVRNIRRDGSTQGGPGDRPVEPPPTRGVCRWRRYEDDRSSRPRGRLRTIHFSFPSDVTADQGHCRPRSSLTATPVVCLTKFWVSPDGHVGRRGRRAVHRGRRERPVAADGNVRCCACEGERSSGRERSNIDREWNAEPTIGHSGTVNMHVLFHRASARCEWARTVERGTVRPPIWAARTRAHVRGNREKEEPTVDRASPHHVRDHRDGPSRGSGGGGRRSVDGRCPYAREAGVHLRGAGRRPPLDVVISEPRISHHLRVEPSGRITARPADDRPVFGPPLADAPPSTEPVARIVLPPQPPSPVVAEDPTTAISLPAVHDVAPFEDESEGHDEEKSSDGDAVSPADVPDAGAPDGHVAAQIDGTGADLTGEDETGNGAAADESDDVASGADEPAGVAGVTASVADDVASEADAADTEAATDEDAPAEDEAPTAPLQRVRSQLPRTRFRRLRTRSRGRQQRTKALRRNRPFLPRPPPPLPLTLTPRPELVPLMHAMPPRSHRRLLRRRRTCRPMRGARRPWDPARAPQPGGAVRSRHPPHLRPTQPP
jgi:hypothetical protein